MSGQTPGQELSAIHKLLADGNVAAATDALSTVAAQVNAAEVAAGLQAAAPEPPRTPDEIVMELFTVLTARLGNHPQLEALTNELAEAFQRAK